MDKKESPFSIVKLGLILAAYAVAACSILAVVYSVTKPKIDANKTRKANEAMMKVFDGVTDFETVTDFSYSPANGSKILSLATAKIENNVIGAVVQVSGATYDHATVMVGIDLYGNISGLQFLENTDSPGFGQKASDPHFHLPSGKTFYGQFTGLNAYDGIECGKTFDAISGATITSAGVGRLVSDGAECALAYLKKIGGEE